MSINKLYIVEEKVSLNHSIPFRNLSINDWSDSVICISPICNQDAIKNWSKLVTKPITTDQNLVSLSQMQNQLNEASNVPNSFINQKLDNCDGQKVNLSERKDVVNRAILRGIKKFYIDLLLNFVPGYKDKRLCRVHKPTLLKDITSLCKRFMESEELPKAVFCLLRPNSIDFIAESESYKEDVLAFIDWIQRYSHKKFNSITKLKFVKVLFSHIHDCEKTLDSFVQVNSLMSKHLEAYSEGIKRFRLLLSENMQENLTESE